MAMMDDRKVIWADLVCDALLILVIFSFAASLCVHSWEVARKTAEREAAERTINIKEIQP